MQAEVALRPDHCVICGASGIYDDDQPESRQRSAGSQKAKESAFDYAFAGFVAALKDTLKQRILEAYERPFAVRDDVTSDILDTCIPGLLLFHCISADSCGETAAMDIMQHATCMRRIMGKLPAPASRARQTRSACRARQQSFRSSNGEL